MNLIIAGILFYAKKSPETGLIPTASGDLMLYSFPLCILRHRKITPFVFDDFSEYP